MKSVMRRMLVGMVGVVAVVALCGLLSGASGSPFSMWVWSVSFGLMWLLGLVAAWGGI